jgi:hypothetical protein
MSASPSHGLVDPTTQGIHVPYQWSYATSAARVAATGFTATDIGKLALQTSDNSLWLLTATTPLWVAVSYDSPKAQPDGWTLYDQVTWVYSSADGATGIFTVAGVDLTGVLTVGTRIKLTQSATVKYFIVTVVSFGGGNTTCTIWGGASYTLANSAISATSYSYAKCPAGFPTNPDTWTVETSDTTAAAQSTPTSGTWYNLGTITIVIPIGLWNISYEVWLQSNSIAAQTSVSQYCSLSTANNSESDTTMTSWVILGSASGTLTLGDTSTRSKVLSLATKTTHYLIAKTIHANNNSINFRGDISPTKIRARCAYL